VTYTTITQATKDDKLIARVRAAIAKEAQNNATLHTTTVGQAVTRFGPDQIIGQSIWSVAIDYEAAYASAVVALNTNPGGDPAVITDGNIQAAVVAHWPTVI
jgi:signal-transduction protein with cAMP-binding, CBS, and nucleotidyltransferase domain